MPGEVKRLLSSLHQALTCPALLSESIWGVGDEANRKTQQPRNRKLTCINSSISFTTELFARPIVPCHRRVLVQRGCQKTLPGQ